MDTVRLSFAKISWKSTIHIDGHQPLRKQSKRENSPVSTFMDFKSGKYFIPKKFICKNPYHREESFEVCHQHYLLRKTKNPDIFVIWAFYQYYYDDNYHYCCYYDFFDFFDYYCHHHYFRYYNPGSHIRLRCVVRRALIRNATVTI